MKYRKILILFVLLWPGIVALAQESPPGYNPFVPANLDDLNKLKVSSVVESSYHYYSLKGDEKYTKASTFVWYVENGTLGNYNPLTDTWTPLNGIHPISNGVYAELQGATLDGVSNSSGIWVRWNDGTGGSTGYIAVYERSSDDCIFENQLSGFKLNIIVPPEVWFAIGNREECSDFTYAVNIQFSKIDQVSYPYKLTYTYPDYDGNIVSADLIINDGDLSATSEITIDLKVADLDQAIDENYLLTLVELRDKFGSLGNIAPLGVQQGQYSNITITIFHLPQTGGMIMD